MAWPLIPKAPLLTVPRTHYPYDYGGHCIQRPPAHFPNQTDHSLTKFGRLLRAPARISSSYLLPLLSQAAQNLSPFWFELAFLSFYFGDWVGSTPKFQDSFHGGSNSNIKTETWDTGNGLLFCQPAPSRRFSLPCQFSGGKQPAPSVVGNHLETDTFLKRYSSVTWKFCLSIKKKVIY